MNVNAIEMGIRIRKLREARQKTQAQLAAQLSISREQLSKLENGTRYPSVITLAELARCCGVSADYILFGYTRREDEAKELEYIISRLRAVQQRL